MGTAQALSTQARGRTLRADASTPSIPSSTLPRKVSPAARTDAKYTVTETQSCTIHHGDRLQRFRCQKGLVSRKIDGGEMFGPPGFEVLRLKRIDDKTVFLEKTHNGVSAPGRQVSYCSDEAQHRYQEQRKAAK